MLKQNEDQMRLVNSENNKLREILNENEISKFWADRNTSNSLV